MPDRQIRLVKTWTRQRAPEDDRLRRCVLGFNSLKRRATKSNGVAAEAGGLHQVKTTDPKKPILPCARSRVRRPIHGGDCLYTCVKGHNLQSTAVVMIRGGRVEGSAWGTLSHHTRYPGIPWGAARRQARSRYR